MSHRFDEVTPRTAATDGSTSTFVASTETAVRYAEIGRLVAEMRGLQDLICKVPVDDIGLADYIRREQLIRKELLRREGFAATHRRQATPAQRDGRAGPGGPGPAD